MPWGDIAGALILMAYYLIGCVLFPTLLKARTRIPTEVIRKIQHIGYSLSIFILLKCFSAWYTAVGAAFVLVLVSYPTLLVVEKTALYRKLFVDRAAGGGELRRQLVYVQLSFGVLIFIFWGLLGATWHYLVAVSVMAWGFGDAAAALVGKFFGRKRFFHRWIEGAKTREGTVAMVVTAALALFLTLMFYGGKSWPVSLIIAVLVAPVSGVVELLSRRGTDTLTVPLSTAGLSLPLVYLLSRLGL